MDTDAALEALHVQGIKTTVEETTVCGGVLLTRRPDGHVFSKAGRITIT